MTVRKSAAVRAAVLIIVIAAAAVSLCQCDAGERNTAQARFFDVGQGDAAVFIWDGGVILFDAGTNDSEDVLVAHLESLGVSRIDCAVLSHPHDDHIGGADAVLQNFDVAEIIMSDTVGDRQAYDALEDAAAESGCMMYEAVAGDVYEFDGVILTILSPWVWFGEGNLDSAVVMLTYGETKFLFTGDCESEAELIALERAGAEAFDCDVLKVGHHGSSTSTSEELLAAATPDIAVISCGADNDYGHPHSDVLERLRSHGIEIYRTDREGTVVIFTDGKSVWAG